MYFFKAGAAIFYYEDLCCILVCMFVKLELNVFGFRVYVFEFKNSNAFKCVCELRHFC